MEKTGDSFSVSELLHDLTITIKETKPPHTITDVSPPADRHVTVHSSRSSFTATPAPYPDPSRPPPLPPKKLVSLTKSSTSRDGSSDECVSRPSSVCSSVTDTSVKELEHDGNAICGNSNDDSLPPAVPERDPVTVVGTFSYHQDKCVDISQTYRCDPDMIL